MPFLRPEPSPEAFDKHPADVGNLTLGACGRQSEALYENLTDDALQCRHVNQGAYLRHFFRGAGISESLAQKSQGLSDDLVEIGSYGWR
jgi:hypothetical protein